MSETQLHAWTNITRQYRYTISPIPDPETLEQIKEAIEEGDDDQGLVELVDRAKNSADTVSAEIEIGGQRYAVSLECWESDGMSGWTNEGEPNE